MKAGRREENIRYWLALTRVFNRPRLLRLITGLGGPRALFEKCRRGGPRPDGLTEQQARSVTEFDDWGWVDNELDRLEGGGFRVIAYDDPGYPMLLKEIMGPPYLLYAKGRPLDDSTPVVAVEGTRHPGAESLAASEEISRGLAQAGYAVASGMAIGCDTAAHRGVLSAGGFTIAVLGTGIDNPYPKRNRGLYEEIAEKGLILSEFPLSTPPEPGNFLKRNRITNGISRGVLVMEAKMRSGSLMTARLAFEAGRMVFAYHGVENPRVRGTRWLIEERGARPVRSAADITRAFKAASGGCGA